MTYHHVPSDKLQESESTLRQNNGLLEAEIDSLNRESHQVYEQLEKSQKETEMLRGEINCLYSSQVSSSQRR